MPNPRPPENLIYNIDPMQSPSGSYQFSNPQREELLRALRQRLRLMVTWIAVLGIPSLIVNRFSLVEYFVGYLTMLTMIQIATHPFFMLLPDWQYQFTDEFLILTDHRARDFRIAYSRIKFVRESRFGLHLPHFRRIRLILASTAGYIQFRDELLRRLDPKVLSWRRDPRIWQTFVVLPLLLYFSFESQLMQPSVLSLATLMGTSVILVWYPSR